MSTVHLGAASLRAPFVAGLLTASLCVAILIAVTSNDVGDVGQQRSRIDRLSPAFDPQEDGPLMDGAKVSVAVAETRTPYRLAEPPTNSETGKRTAVWIDITKQVAFVWETNLRFYAHKLTDMSEAEYLETWTDIVAGGEGKLVTVLGHTGIVFDDGPGSDPSSLDFIHDGVSLQFVSPNHTAEELKGFAEAIRFE